MAELKTKLTNQSPRDFLSTIEPEQKQQDSLVLLEMFEQVTGEAGTMWGPSIIGFGKYHYKSQRSAQEGDWFHVGFSPRKQNLTLYILHGNEERTDLLAKLGKHKTSKGCVYINKLADVDQTVLKKLIESSFAYTKAHPLYS